MTTISPRALYRSADETLTPTMLKNSDYIYEGSQQTIDEIGERCNQYGISGTDRTQSNFPQKLTRFPGFPEVVYRMGNSNLFNESLLAIVGPRKPSIYINEVMQVLFQSLHTYQLVTISGGAEGIDLMAHLGSLERGIPTIVVLGAGFRRYKNNQGRSFFEKVVEKGGLILSERKLDQSPTVYTYPQRNRLVAGCADAVFIPGAAKGSGSLITVDFALKFGIPIGTVPGSIFEITSAGTNQYLSEKKIKAWCSVDDFLREYFIGKNQVGGAIVGLTDIEKKIVELLNTSPGSVALLSKTMGLSFSDVLMHLSCLEIKGVVSLIQPGAYGLKK